MVVTNEWCGSVPKSNIDESYWLPLNVDEYVIVLRFQKAMCNCCRDVLQSGVVFPVSLWPYHMHWLSCHIVAHDSMHTARILRVQLVVLTAQGHQDRGDVVTMLT